MTPPRCWLATWRARPWELAEACSPTMSSWPMRWRSVSRCAVRSAQGGAGVVGLPAVRCGAEVDVADAEEVAGVEEGAVVPARDAGSALVVQPPPMTSPASAAPIARRHTALEPSGFDGVTAGTYPRGARPE